MLSIVKKQDVDEANRSGSTIMDAEKPASPAPMESQPMSDTNDNGGGEKEQTQTETPTQQVIKPTKPYERIMYNPTIQGLGLT